ncbi:MULTISPECIES: lytic transglycosylase domain-containing protein [unclassified Streptosporangium]|uniref:lytic transglycosylase domain-containing protein n=1 Tax=unclassified Streptosporangium TaxID=2632669 RepID=UPI002E296EE4|nr:MULTISPECIES: lytic transglycosylase domain-containing protein [unclassified Streptosporangium]
MTPARPDASGGRSPNVRTGRSRGRPILASLVGLVVAISGCATSQSAASQDSAAQGAAQDAASQGAARGSTPQSAPSESAAASAAPGQKTTPPSETSPAKESAHQTTPAGQVPALPSPEAAIPTDPSRLARSLTTTTAELRRAIDAWRRDGDPGRGSPPEPVVLLALHQQRIYRYLVLNPKIASRTYAKLPKALAGQAKDNVTAGRDLRSLVRPISGAAKFRVQPAKPADFLLGHFRHAERRFGVEWEVLAAVMFVETKFGRVRSPSHTGAKGPMQFMPGTWAAYGMGGDIQDTRDSLLAAANYLRASGAPRDYRRALYAYNHSQAYVNAVLLHTRQIKQDIRNYYAYYNWQVFVVTTRGDRRLTGP